MVPDAQTVAAFGTLPLPALIILAMVVAALGGSFIFVKFGDGRKSGPKTEDFQVRLATFDPKSIALLIQEIGKASFETERQTEAAQELGRDIRELCRIMREFERRGGLN